MSAYSRHLSEWPDNFLDAKQQQEKLAHKVILKNQFKDLNFYAGVDAGFDLRQHNTHAAVVVLDAQLNVIETATATLPTRFPYVPGYLSFREGPAILTALEQLIQKPDILVCDGQGYAHPRRFGIACHLGVITDTPSVGVAKSRFIGTYQEPPAKKGSSSPLMDNGERIGAVLRTRDNVKPLFISPGHKIDFESAVEIVLKLTTRYRLPEPIRYADRLSREYEN
jgi:deoxyribonuclease V